MTQLNTNSMKTILQEGLEKDGDFLRVMVRSIIQEVMEEERDKQVGVLSHQRDNTKRKANRNGYKSRSSNTRAGSLLLAKPQIREFPFQTQLFENYQRSEKALLASICQMVADGVSTNRVKKIVGRLSPDLTYSKSTVSRITQELDPQIKRWQDEKLKDYYTYIIEVSYPKVSHMLQEELEFTLTYLSYPKHHRRKIRTTNLIEGVINKDLKQRSGVVGIFPNQKSCMRYVSLRLMETDEEWQTGRRYMKMGKEDQFPHEDDPLLCKIKEMKEGVRAQEELVVL